ncbi:MAG: two-component sensor histidine kinase [Pelomonas sp.]|nr:two-component sensor histidine kinase [Roseateles sp.]
MSRARLPSLPAWARASAASLKGRLLLFLLAAVCLAAALQAWSSYRTALQEADQIFDYHMQQMALSLGGSLGGGVQSANDDMELVIQAWTAEGLQVFQSTGRARMPARAVLGFSNVAVNDHMYRVLSVQSGGQIVQVAQELAVRERLARRLAWRTVLPVAAMVPLLMIVVGWVVSHSLAPVERVRAQLARRAADDLAPVASEGLPAEIEPMVGELNSLLGRVQQSVAAQQHFVADAAHELRSPLTALKLQVQSLQRAHDDAARQLAQARLAAGIDRATRLVEQLLLLARHDNQAAPREAVALAPLVEQVVAEHAAAAAARGVDLGIARLDAATVAGQPDALAVLVRNLVDNAIKYAPEGGKVDVSLFAAPAPTLRVDDSGPGIAPAERERVLDRFYRSPDRPQEASGSGLGLAIVDTIAGRHGASLLLATAEPLGGLRAEVRFPAASF